MSARTLICIPIAVAMTFMSTAPPAEAGRASFARAYRTHQRAYRSFNRGFNRSLRHVRRDYRSFRTPTRYRYTRRAPVYPIYHRPYYGNSAFLGGRGAGIYLRF